VSHNSILFSSSSDLSFASILSPMCERVVSESHWEYQKKTAQREREERSGYIEIENCFLGLLFSRCIEMNIWFRFFFW
jgi:hypothetical protein